MAMVQCKKFGHSYDSQEHPSGCPYCGVEGIDDTWGTPPEPPPPPPPAGAQIEKGHTIAHGTTGPRGPRPGSAHPETISGWVGRQGFDPVVGWLVCVEGPERGRDFRIRPERNNIGRDPGQRDGIFIPGDPSISREKHAVISYNPKNHRFNLIPGDGRGITYLNDEELLTPHPLSPYDRIEMGSSKFIFVPFCGELFTWPAAEGAPD